MSVAWTNASLGELCNISIGRTPSRAEPRYWGAGHRWLSIADLSQGEDLFESKEQITDAAVDECHCRPVAPGTLVMSFKLSVGKMGFVRRQMFTNEAIAAFVLRDAERIDSRFLYRALQVAPLLRDADRAVKGLTLNSEKLARTSIRFPPSLLEQRRIANILDNASALRRKRNEAIALTEELLRTTFLEMFGDPVSNAKGWPRCKMGELCTRITDGTHLTPTFIQEGVPFLFVRNVVDGRLTFETDKYISEDVYSELTRRCPIERDDVLYVTVGATYGDAVLVETKERFCFQRHLAQLKPDRRVATPRFLHALLRSHAVKRQADRRVKGAAQPTLNLTELRDFDVFMPPLSIQEDFGQAAAALEVLRLKQVSAARVTDELFDTLAHRAFRDKLAAPGTKTELASHAEAPTHERA